MEHEFLNFWRTSKEVMEANRRTFRASRWARNFITCSHHDRRCRQSLYVRKRQTLCSSCANRKVSGERRPSFSRNRNTRSYNKSIALRERFLGGRLFGLRLFERATGMQVPLGRWRVA